MVVYGAVCDLLQCVCVLIVVCMCCECVFFFRVTELNLKECFAGGLALRVPALFWKNKKIKHFRSKSCWIIQPCLKRINYDPPWIWPGSPQRCFLFLFALLSSALHSFTTADSPGNDGGLFLWITVLHPQQNLSRIFTMFLFWFQSHGFLFHVILTYAIMLCIYSCINVLIHSHIFVLHINIWFISNREAPLSENVLLVWVGVCCPSLTL